VAAFEAGFSGDDKMAAVQYLKFPVDGAMETALADPSQVARLTADNRRYRGEAVLSAKTREGLLRDLAVPA
jgi:hypothetical protein